MSLRKISGGNDANDTSLSRLVDILRLLQKDVTAPRVQENLIKMNPQVSQIPKSVNRFGVLESEDMETQEGLESLAVSSEATPELQASLSPLSQATIRNIYIEDDPLAYILEIFFILFVSFAELIRFVEC